MKAWRHRKAWFFFCWIPRIVTVVWQ